MERIIDENKYVEIKEFKAWGNSQKMLFVDTSSKKVRDNFAKNRTKATEKLRKLFPASGVDLIDITTGSDYVKPLINFFKNRGKRRWKN